MPRSIDGHGRVEHEVAAAGDADGLAVVVDDVGLDAGERERRAPGLAAWSRLAAG